MKIFGRFFSILLVILLSACVSPPQAPISLSRDAIIGQPGRVGIAMAPLPKVDIQVPGADCLLCLAFAYAANSGITSYGQTLPNDDLLALKAEVASILTKKGANIRLIDTELNLSALPDTGSKGPNIASKDFSSLQQKYQIEKLLVIDISALGFTRSYSAYFPTSDPKAMLRGAAYLVNLKNNTYEWYEPIFIVKSADQAWDEPPKYPGLTNAYFQAIEMGRDRIRQPIAALSAEAPNTTAATAPAATSAKGPLP